MLDLPALLAETRQRNLDCDGIPMILMLRGGRPAPAGDPRRADGARLAMLLAEVHAALAEVGPDGRPDVVDGAEPDDEVPLAALRPEDRLLAEAVTITAHVDFGPAAGSGAESTDGAGAAGDGAGAAGGTAPDREVEATGTDTDEGGALGAMLEALREGRFLRVVNYHNTPAARAEELRAELEGYARRFAPVGTDELHRLITEGRWDAERAPLIPVFYEGYRNNADVAAPACRHAGLVGWFFVITGFVDTPPEEQVAFARGHDIGLVGDEADADRIAMTWAEVAEVAGDHVVSSHTASHSAVTQIRTPDDFERELWAPTRAVAEVTGRPSPAHAWLYGTGVGTSPEHDAALRNSDYRWCFSNTAIDDLAATPAARVA